MYFLKKNYSYNSYIISQTFTNDLTMINKKLFWPLFFSSFWTFLNYKRILKQI